jgi:hypothetical protein
MAIIQKVGAASATRHPLGSVRASSDATPIIGVNFHNKTKVELK